MITTYYRNIKDAKLLKIDKFRTGSWIHIQSPTEDELSQVIEKFGLEAGHVRDALDPDEMPRLETEGDTTYVFMRYTYNNDGRLLTAPIALIIGPKVLITITAQPFPRLELFTQGKLEVFTTQRAKLFLQLMRHSTNTYNTGLNTINRQIRSARAGLNVTSISNRNFVQFVVIEDVLNDYLSELMPTNTMLTNLLAGKHNLSFFEEDRDLIEDLVLGTRQSIEASKSNLRTIVNIREAYSNIMTNNLNRQIKLLTSLTIILMIPNVIAGFFGMNVPIPLGAMPWAFPLILLSTLGLCGYLIWLFNRRGWL
jgi:magnesium transporter